MRTTSAARVLAAVLTVPIFTGAGGRAFIAGTDIAQFLDEELAR